MRQRKRPGDVATWRSCRAGSVVSADGVVPPPRFAASVRSGGGVPAQAHALPDGIGLCHSARHASPDCVIRVPRCVHAAAGRSGRVVITRCEVAVRLRLGGAGLRPPLYLAGATVGQGEPRHRRCSHASIRGGLLTWWGAELQACPGEAEPRRVDALYSANTRLARSGLQADCSSRPRCRWASHVIGSQRRDRRRPEVARIPVPDAPDLS